MEESPFDPPGGSFLLSEEAPARILTPEQLGSEARLLADAATDFMRGEVLPASDRLQNQEPALMRSLLEHAGQLGLLGLEIPDIDGGLGLHNSAATRIAEVVSVEPSFAVSHNVHTSVATLPTLFFGNPEQKTRVLPRLASGEWIGAYALSEAGAGSDAMAARTRASRTGNVYALTGEKMWITNAAFADLFTVFARIEGQEGLTAFVVERDRPGLSVGREEHKLGLKGSSTCRLLLDNVRIPAENRIAEEGEGGRVALNTLNLGRFKIAASSVGRSKDVLGIAARYAVERKAFGRSIAEFGLVSQKLARMAARIFAAESMLYRLVGDLYHAFGDIDPASSSAPTLYRAAAEEYAIECALLKVFCTETLDLCADECLQIHGGYGYTEEFPAARAWRDARVNRIYEGTSEINRYNAAQMLARRSRSGKLDLVRTETSEASALGLLTRMEEAGGPPQEAQGALADLAVELYARQSMRARVEAMPAGARVKALLAESVSLFEAEPRRWAAFRLLYASLGKDEKAQWTQLAGSLIGAPMDPIATRRDLALEVTNAGAYPF